MKNRKRLVSILAGIMAAIMLLTLIIGLIPTPASAYSSSEIRKQINELKKQKSEIEEQIKRDAVRIFRAMDCRGLSRVDFFLDRKTGELVFNEINTLPGFTPISMYPMLIQKHGISNGELVSRLIDDALKHSK